MGRLNITAKIWLSIGVFVLGAVFPASRYGQEAQAAFQRMAKAYSDAVVLEDASSLDRADEEGKAVAASLTAAAALPGLSPTRAKDLWGACRVDQRAGGRRADGVPAHGH